MQVPSSAHGLSSIWIVCEAWNEAPHRVQPDAMQMPCIHQTYTKEQREEMAKLAAELHKVHLVPEHSVETHLSVWT